LKSINNYSRIVIDLFFVGGIVNYSLLIYYIISKKGGVHGHMHEWYNLTFSNYLLIILFGLSISIIGLFYGIRDYPNDFFYKRKLILKIILATILLIIEIFLSINSGKG
jgi:hypothetical protein